MKNLFIAFVVIAAFGFGVTASGLGKVQREQVAQMILQAEQDNTGAINIRSLGCSDKVDCAAILSKYIASQPMNARIKLFMPPGNWYFQTTFYWEDRTVEFTGAGMSQTFIYVTPNVVGIWANRKYGIVGINVLADFWIGAGSKGKDSTADGIRIWHQTNVRNVSVSNFSGDGILIDGFVVGDPLRDAAHNASFSKVYDCQISANARNGVEIQGQDGNACVVFASDIRNNGGYGIFESSFLGGTHVANMFHANRLGARSTDAPTNQSAFIGGYIENDQPPSQFAGNDVKVFGGFNVTGNKNGKIY